MTKTLTKQTEAGMLCKTPGEVYEFYRTACQKVCAKLKEAVILKTDVFNEITPSVKGIVPVIGHLPNVYHTFSVEIQEHKVKEARRLYDEQDVTILHADLCVVGFDENMFDAIFDLNTIDHLDMEEAKLVVSKYYTWLKPGGALLVTCWTWDKPSTKSSQHNGQEQQYFNLDEFERAIINAGFFTDDRKAIFGRKAEVVLMGYWCRK